MSRVQRDLLLSSGFLAFARHAGVLAAVEEAAPELDIGAVVGTSSGSLAGALWAAGHSASDVARELSQHRPLGLMRGHLQPWRGLFHLGALVRYLEGLLPPTFAELRRPLALGVVTTAGEHRLLTSGSLPHAVAASCAMPWVFKPVTVAGVPYQDGGAADRLCVDPWRAWRPGRQAIAHQVERTAGKNVDTDLSGVQLIATPRSGATFFSLGDFHGQVAEARQIARTALAAALGATPDAR